MNNTTNFELQTYEANDIVNVMTVDKSNMEKIDEVMKANQLSGIGTATELKSGSVHALTRANSDVSVFRFTATSNFTAGDTFVVDTMQVTALLPSGESLGTGAYVIGAEVLCSLRDTLLTVYVTTGEVAVAADSERLGGNLPEYYGTASDVAQALATASAAGVLAQSNTQLISGLDTRVETLENQSETYEYIQLNETLFCERIGKNVYVNGYFNAASTNADFTINNPLPRIKGDKSLNFICANEYSYGRIDISNSNLSSIHYAINTRSNGIRVGFSYITD